jgi:hypothetical protein
MRSSASLRTWGPSLRYALPVIIAALGLAWTAWRSDSASEPQAAVEVTTLKPVIEELAAGERPVEVAYGVPTPRTIGLWRPFWPPAR